jgi:hypothetical protein
VTEDEAARMIEGIGERDRCLVIFPVGDQSGLRWLGMSAEQAAETLYRVADELVRQHVPLRHSAPKGIQ